MLSSFLLCDCCRVQLVKRRFCFLLQNNLKGIKLSNKEEERDFLTVKLNQTSQEDDIYALHCVTWTIKTFCLHIIVHQTKKLTLDVSLRFVCKVDLTSILCLLWSHVSAAAGSGRSRQLFPQLLCEEGVPKAAEFLLCVLGLPPALLLVGSRRTTSTSPHHHPPLHCA